MKLKDRTKNYKGYIALNTFTIGSGTPQPMPLLKYQGKEVDRKGWGSDDPHFNQGLLPLYAKSIFISQINTGTWGTPSFAIGRCGLSQPYA